ncbi:hypothetical protein M2408_000694 [Sphingobacterium sp. BIGb0165]|nr:hypothetical protein [Sphingobacterium sp. BIGb0165]
MKNIDKAIEIENILAREKVNNRSLIFLSKLTEKLGINS